MQRTDNQRNHGCPVSAGGLEALDQLLHLPYLDVLLRIVRLRRTHDGRRMGATAGEGTEGGGGGGGAGERGKRESLVRANIENLGDKTRFFRKDCKEE